MGGAGGFAFKKLALEQGAGAVWFMDDDAICEKTR